MKSALIILFWVQAAYASDLQAINQSSTNTITQSSIPQQAAKGTTAQSPAPTISLPESATDYTKYAAILISLAVFIYTIGKDRKTDKRLKHVELEQEREKSETAIHSKRVKDNLGGFIRELENRTNKIGAMKYSAYEKVLVDFDGRLIDKGSHELIIKVYEFIRENVGLVEAELFDSVTELSKDENLERQIGSAEPHGEKTRTYMIGRLQLHVRQLKPIIASIK